MKKYLLLLLLISANLYAFPIPKDNEVSFDIIRKNKIFEILLLLLRKKMINYK